MSRTFVEIARHPTQFAALVALAIAVSILALFLAQIATQAVHDDNLFELDVDNTGASCPDPNGPQTPFPVCGNANTFDDSGAGAPYDWETICQATNLTTDRTITAITPVPAGVSVSSCDADWFLPDHTTFATGSKDIGDIAPGGFVGAGTWACATDNNVLEKDEIVNAYAALITNPADDHNQLYFGLERPSNNGTSFMGFWFLQSAADCTGPDQGSANWTGGLHVPGDLLILSDFSGGGRVSNLRVLEWNPNNVLADPTCDVPGAMLPDSTVGPLCQIATGADCSAVAADDDVCGVVNNETVTTPWWNEPRRPPCNADGVQAAPGTTNPCTVPLESNQLFEGGVDLTEVLDTTSLPCFSTFIAETRSSDTETADLKDFTRGQFDTCGTITVVKDTVPDDAQDFSYSNNITNDSPTPCATTFSLDDDGDPGLDLSNTRFCENVSPGTYTVTEDTVSGFTLADISCTITDNGTLGDTDVNFGTSAAGPFHDTFVAGDTTAQIILGPLDDVTCTFTNTKLFKKIVITCDTGTETLVDSTETLTLLDGITTLTKETINSADAAAAGVSEATLCGLGEAGDRQFDNLAQGTYSQTTELPDVAPLFPTPAP